MQRIQVARSPESNLRRTIGMRPTHPHLRLPILRSQRHARSWCHDSIIRKSCPHSNWLVVAYARHDALTILQTWGQDAHRFGAYSKPDANQHLIDLVLRNLATLHNIPVSYLQEQFLDSFTVDWYASEFSVGAFAEFAPGQSGSLMPEMLSPAGKGDRVHFAGDSLSIGHAWIVGGLNSGFRAVQDIVIKGMGRTDMGIRLREEWGPLVSLHLLNSLLFLMSSLLFKVEKFLDIREVS